MLPILESSATIIVSKIRREILELQTSTCQIRNELRFWIKKGCRGWQVAMGMSRTRFSSTFLGHWSDKYNERQTKVVLNRMEKGVRVLSFLLQYQILLRGHCSNLPSVHPSSAPIPVHQALFNRFTFENHLFGTWAHHTILRHPIDKHLLRWPEFIHSIKTV